MILHWLTVSDHLFSPRGWSTLSLGIAFEVRFLLFYGSQIEQQQKVTKHRTSLTNNKQPGSYQTNKKR